MSEPSNQPLVVGLGELLWDIFDDLQRPGGAPANVAFHAQQLGCRGVVCSRVGNDPLGMELVDFLQAEGLPTEAVQRDVEHATGTVTVDTSRPGDPRYVIHQDVAWEHLECDEALTQIMQQAAAVCFGTLAQRSARSRRAIYKSLGAVSRECLVVYDVNLRQRWYNRAWIERSLGLSRLVKLNDTEVTALAELLQTTSTNHETFARYIQRRYNVATVCITRAERGCQLFDRHATADSPGIVVEVADSVGAGDAFTAALIVARLRGWPLQNQADFANQVGALVASHAGAMPALRDEFSRLAERFE
ncbi:MAG: carbohydrate kinase [Planctomycetes bacterium]|nr:carbohydrate kinase [Planctomycetota bacterium]